jgi:hypothetical protein
MKTALLAVLLALSPKPLQELPNAFPRAGARQLIDNERVTVWDVTVEKGNAMPPHRYPLDVVTVDLSGASAKKGQVSFSPKGTTEKKESPSDAPRHSIVVELKDVKVPPLPNKTGYPDAFPREGSKKVLDNPRVVVWDFSWTPGKATAMHFHDKDVVVVYLDNGDLSSITLDGKTTVNSYVFGQAKFNARDRIHSELLTKGSQRVIAIELK